MNPKKLLSSMFIAVGVICATCSLSVASHIPIIIIIPCASVTFPSDHGGGELEACTNAGAGCGVFGFGICEDNNWNCDCVY